MKLTDYAPNAALSLGRSPSSSSKSSPADSVTGSCRTGGGLLLATALRASTDVVICTIPYRLTTR